MDPKTGDTKVGYAYRTMDAPEWPVARCYFKTCAPATVRTSTLGTSELLASATVGMRSQAVGQIHHLCLGDVVAVALSLPSGGSPP